MHKRALLLVLLLLVSCFAERRGLSRDALMKTLPHAPEGFFEAEVAGLRWLSEVEGGVPVPEVLAAASDCVILEWIEPSSKTPVEAAVARDALPGPLDALLTTVSAP